MNWLCLFRPHGKMSLINIFSPFFVLWRVDLTLHLPKAFCLQLSTWFSMPGSTQQRSQQILEEHHTYLFCSPTYLSVSLRFCFRWTFLPCDLQACLECVSDFWLTILFKGFTGEISWKQNPVHKVTKHFPLCPRERQKCHCCSLSHIDLTGLGLPGLI